MIILIILFLTIFTTSLPLLIYCRLTAVVIVFSHDCATMIIMINLKILFIYQDHGLLPIGGHRDDIPDRLDAPYDRQARAPPARHGGRDQVLSGQRFT